MSIKWRSMATAPRDGALVLLNWKFCKDDSVAALISTGSYANIYREWKSNVRLPQYGCGCCSFENFKPSGWLPLDVLPTLNDDDLDITTGV